MPSGAMPRTGGRWSVKDRGRARTQRPARCSPIWYEPRRVCPRQPARCSPPWRMDPRRLSCPSDQRIRILQHHDAQSRVSVSLTLDQVKERARRAPMVPIYRDMLSDARTPVTAYAALAADGPAYLLESVERGEQLGP